MDEKTNISQSKIVVIDNDFKSCEVLVNIFSNYGYKREFFSNIEKAIKEIKEFEPNALLLASDQIAENIFQKKLFEWAELNNCPILILVNEYTENIINDIYNIGAADYILKPFCEKEVVTRIKMNIMVRQVSTGAKGYGDFFRESFLSEYTKELKNRERDLHATKDYVNSQFAIIELVSGFSDLYRGETKRSIRRVQLLSAKIARYLAVYNKFSGEVTEEFIGNIVLASSIYDCGMAGISQKLVNTADKLREKEKIELKKHTEIGLEMIEEIYEKFPQNTMLIMAMDIAHYHHERFDGSGYPKGLNGFNIPLSARIVAIADVYDALISSTNYRQKYTVQGAINTITGMWKHQFDPDILEAFLTVVDKKQDQRDCDEL